MQTRFVSKKGKILTFHARTINEVRFADTSALEEIRDIFDGKVHIYSTGKSLKWILVERNVTSKGLGCVHLIKQISPLYLKKLNTNSGKQ